jgi:hypothetical protein
LTERVLQLGLGLALVVGGDGGQARLSSGICSHC